MTSKFSIDNRELLQRISSGEAVVGIDFGNLIVRELAAFRLAAMDSSESVELPLDYLQGHKDGLEWAAKLVEANHPETGDWLYDDPIELAKAIRKGPDMPPVQPAQVVPEDVRQALSKMDDEIIAELDAEESACRAAMLHAGNSLAQSDCCQAKNCIHSAQGVDRPVAWHHTAKSKEGNHGTCCFSYASSHDFGPRYEKPQISRTISLRGWIMIELCISFPPNHGK
ncbi:hypothetical protein M4C73_03425 [Klebsiella pneumoniae]|nr:hypothetical protein [Klebsiella pneumoniae]